jgi:hypothetical protein
MEETNMETNMETAKKQRGTLQRGTVKAAAAAPIENVQRVIIDLAALAPGAVRVLALVAKLEDFKQNRWAVDRDTLAEILAHS